MVAQVITSPFKLVSIATNGAPAVQLSLDEGFRQSGTLYQIKSGSFSISGGVAGRKEAFQLQGKLQVSRLYPLITIGFAVVSADAPRARSLRDTATGLLTDNTIAIQRLSRGSLLDSPAGELQVRGSLAEKRKLRLELNSGPVTVPDGFSGQGTIEGEQLVTTVRQ